MKRFFNFFKQNRRLFICFVLPPTFYVLDKKIKFITPQPFYSQEINQNTVNYEQKVMLCKFQDLSENTLYTYKINQKQILVAKINNKIHACEAISPVDGITRFDEKLLIGDRIFDTVNGAIYSIDTGLPEYSPNLNQLIKYDVSVNEETQNVMINLSQKKRVFDSINMIGWIPDFHKIVIFGSGIDTLNIVRTLRFCKFSGIISILLGEKNLQWPYDRELLLEDIQNIQQVNQDQTFAQQFDVQIIKGKDQENLDIKLFSNTIEEANANPIKYNKLVYCLGKKGFSQNFNEFLNNNYKGIYLSPTKFTDFVKIKENMNSFKKIVLYGNSTQTIKLALNLKNNISNSEVIILSENDVLLQNMNTQKHISNFIETELQKQNIQILKNKSIQKIVASQQNVIQKIILSDNTNIECDSLFLMQQEIPNLDSLQKSDNNEQEIFQPLYVNPFYKTSFNNIWSYGSTASIIQPFIAKGQTYESQGDLMVQSQSLALNLIQKRQAIRFVPFEKINLGKSQINIIGFPQQSNRYQIDKNDKNEFIIYYFYNDLFVGAASPSRFRELAILREGIYQDIIPRGIDSFNSEQILNKIRNLKYKNLKGNMMDFVNQKPYVLK